MSSPPPDPASAEADLRLALLAVSLLALACALQLLLARALSASAPPPLAAGVAAAVLAPARGRRRAAAVAAAAAAASAAATSASSTACGCTPRPRASLALTVGGLACAWFAASLAIVHLNRLLFGFMGRRLSFPLTVTAGHMLVKGVLAAAAVALSGAYTTPELLLLPPLQRLRMRWQRLVEQHGLSRRVFLAYLAPLGACTALDVWLSNEALRSIDVSVYTTAKSTALFWNVCLSLALRLISPSPRLLAAVLALLAGALLSSLKDAGAEPAGLACALGAAACSATRWVLSESFLTRRGGAAAAAGAALAAGAGAGAAAGTGDGPQVPQPQPPDVMLLAALMAPASLLTLLPPLALELAALAKHGALSDPADARLFAAAILGGGGVALLLVTAELQVSARTSRVLVHFAHQSPRACADQPSSPSLKLSLSLLLFLSYCCVASLSR